MERFVGRVAIVTGAGGPGSGAAIARRFASEGAAVVASDVNEAGLDKLVADAQRGHGGEIVGKRADVTNPEDITDLIEFTVSRYGRLDVLANHAWAWNVRRMAPAIEARAKGDMSKLGGSILDIDPDVWRDGAANPLFAAFYACRVALPHLIESKGCVVNTASISGSGGDFGMSAYNTAKAGLLNLTHTLALDHGHQGVRFNSVSPGAIVYEGGVDWAAMGVEKDYLYLVPLGRFATPDDIAGGVAFLASDDASYITGHNLVIDGGITASSGQYPAFKKIVSSDPTKNS